MDLKKIIKDIGLDEWDSIFRIIICFLMVLFWIICGLKAPQWGQALILMIICVLIGLITGVNFARDH